MAFNRKIQWIVQPLTILQPNWPSPLCSSSPYNYLRVESKLPQGKSPNQYWWNDLIFKGFSIQTQIFIALKVLPVFENVDVFQSPGPKWHVISSFSRSAFTNWNSRRLKGIFNLTRGRRRENPRPKSLYRVLDLLTNSSFLMEISLWRHEN